MLRALINSENQVLRWPLWERHIREMFPDVSFPNPMQEDIDLTHLGLVNVPPDNNAPEAQPGTKVVLGALEWADGRWCRTYVQAPADYPPVD